MPDDPNNPTAADKAQTLERLNAGFRRFVPHNEALGIEVIDYGAGSATMSLPYDPRFVGNPDTGVLHGGVITSLLDATCGASVFVKLPEPAPIATLDLRIDYLKPATPGRAVIARAECYKLTRNVAFVRAIAYHDDENDPVATAAATFMLNTRGQPLSPRKKSG